MSALTTKFLPVLTFAALLSLIAAPAFGKTAAAKTAPTKAAAAKTASVRSPGDVSRITATVSQQIFSPYCPGETIAICPSSGAAIIRRQIQNMARKGMAPEKIKDAILAKYGEKYRVVQPPAKDDYGLLTVLLIGLILCVSAVVYLARRRAQAQAAADEDHDIKQWAENNDVSPKDAEYYLQEVRDEYMD